MLAGAIIAEDRPLKPTEILSQEHRVIELVLDCLERMADDAVASQQIDASSAREAIQFFRHFADGCHHAKEENQLFPFMESKGFSRTSGPVGVMLYEHVVGRDAVRQMEQAIDDFGCGREGAAERFAAHARRYIDMLRQHIQKEDHCLFAMADQALSDNEQATLLERFAQAERQLGEGTRERYLAMAEDLATRFAIDFVAGVPGAMSLARPLSPFAPRK